MNPLKLFRALTTCLPASIALAGALAVVPVSPAAEPPGAVPHMHAAREPSGCNDATLACASAVTPFVDANGALWIAWSAGGAVSVARSSDRGRTFGAPTVIDAPGQMLDVGADARPQIVVTRQGAVLVAYGVFKDKSYNARVMLARSADGATFSRPRSLSLDAASQRFPALGMGADGSVFAAWLDKRTVAAAKRNGVEASGAALAYAWSRDQGASFAPEAIAKDGTCECCRLALAYDRQSHPALLFRSIYGRERDHAVLTFADDARPGAPHRVAVDRWAIDGCPHHGPGLAIGSDGTYHAAWFTQGDARQGLFYASSRDAGVTFSEPTPVGRADRQPGRPQLLAVGDTVWLAWKEFDGREVTIKERHSVDRGAHFTDDRVVAATTATADHPMLVAMGGQAYLSWMTRSEGYRLIALEKQP